MAPWTTIVLCKQVVFHSGVKTTCLGLVNALHLGQLLALGDDLTPPKNDNKDPFDNQNNQHATSQGVGVVGGPLGLTQPQVHTILRLHPGFSVYYLLVRRGLLTHQRPSGGVGLLVGERRGSGAKP